MGDMADFTNDAIMSEWEYAMDNEEPDEMGFIPNPGMPAVEGRYPKFSKKRKPNGPGKCPKCGQNTALKTGAFGKFYGCIDFPTCKGSRNF